VRVVALAAADLVRRVARPGEVALEHVHVAVARVPDRREGVWRPAVELHQDEAHREAVAHDDQRVGALAAGAQVDAAHPPLPPRAEPAVHVGAALARREAVEEAADAHLLGAGRSELVALQVANSCSRTRGSMYVWMRLGSMAVRRQRAVCRTSHAPRSVREWRLGGKRGQGRWASGFAVRCGASGFAVRCDGGRRAGDAGRRVAGVGPPALSAGTSALTCSVRSNGETTRCARSEPSTFFRR